MHDEIFEKLAAAENETEREWLLLEMVLQTLDPALQEAVWAAAVPHWFDALYLAALLDEERVDPALFTALTNLSFVELFPGRGYNVHERSRALLLEKLWQTDRPRYRLYSSRAAAYCAGQDQAETAWRVETIYHLLVADPDRGVTQLQNTGWEWQNPPNFAYDKVEALSKSAREHADAGRLTKRGLGWTLFWEAHLEKIFSRNFSAKEKLQEINITKDEDPYLAADRIRALGDVHVRLAEYEAARGWYEEALAIYEGMGDRLGQANCIKALGDVHVRLAEYEEARGRYEAALPIYEGIGARLGQANCIRALGDVHVMLAEYEAARGRYEAALPIYEGMGARLGQANCIRALGDVHVMLAEYEAARGRYEAALPIYEGMGARLGQANCIQALGQLYKYKNEFEKARKYYEEAITIYRDIGAQLGEMNTLTELADLDRFNEEWDKARKKYLQILSFELENGLRNNAAITCQLLGHTEKGAGNIKSARDYYERALDLFTQIGSPTAQDVRADLEALG